MLENFTAHFEQMMQMMIAQPSTAIEHMHVGFNAIPAADQEAFWWALIVACFVPYGPWILTIFLIYVWFLAAPVESA
jgi:hypothetical protein